MFQPIYNFSKTHWNGCPDRPLGRTNYDKSGYDRENILQNHTYASCSFLTSTKRSNCGNKSIKCVLVTARIDLFSQWIRSFCEFELIYKKHENSAYNKAYIDWVDLVTGCDSQHLLSLHLRSRKMLKTFA